MNREGKISERREGYRGRKRKKERRENVRKERKGKEGEICTGKVRGR